MMLRVSVSALLIVVIGFGCVLPDAGAPGAATFIVSSVADLIAALENLPAEGGRIIVCEGTYVLTASIDINRDNVIIEGEGPATFFTLADGVNGPCFVVGEPTPAQPTVTHHHIVLRNLRISGNRAGQTSEQSTVPGREHLRVNGITLRQVGDCTVEDVVVESARSGGIVLELTCNNILLRGITTSDNFFDRIAVDGSSTDSTITECTCRNNLAAGISFDIGPSSNRVVNSTLVDNGTTGVFIRDSRRNLFSDCFIARNGQDGVFIADGDGPGAAATENTFSANYYVDNGRNGIWQAGPNSTDNVVDGGVFQGNAANAIEESFPLTAQLVEYDVTIVP